MPSRAKRLPSARRLLPADADWPAARLAELPDPPAELRVCGVLPSLTPAVAVVGTRFADDEALTFARNLAGGLAASGWTVISGGALGIDSAAHQGALEAGGTTLAVLATGFDPPYPPRNEALFQTIAERGALISEQPDGSPPVRWSFLGRNRLIAALAQAVVVVQAPLRSGALSTAAAGFRLKRPVFAVTYAPWDPRGEGCLHLLRRGAQICTSYRDVLSVPVHGVGEGQAERSDGDQEPRLGGENGIAADALNLDTEQQAVLDELSRKPRHPDELSSVLGWPAMKVQRTLLQLLLQGLAVERVPGKYARKSVPDQR